MTMELFQGTITLSGNLDYFRRGEAYFVHHNLFGYILEMSRDLIDFLEYFRGAQRSSDDVKAHFSGTFNEDQLREFTQVFLAQGCLVPEGKSEEEVALKMVPFHARWSVYHQPRSGPVTLYRPEPEQDKVEVIVLKGWDAELWRLIDQERTLEEIVAALRSNPASPGVGLEDMVVATVSKLTHGDAQFLKLSPKPLSEYRSGANPLPMPPYLKSTMPYPKVTAEIRGEKTVHVGLDVEEDARLSREHLERDRIETTLSHLFRDPHPALGGRSYGGALAHLYLEQGALAPGSRVLNVGGTTGELTVGFLDELKGAAPEVYTSIAFTVVAEEKEAASRVEAAAAEAGHDVTVLVGPLDALPTLEGIGQAYDLILCNEYLANLESVLLRKLTVGSDEEDEEELEAEEAAEGDVVDAGVDEDEVEPVNGAINGTNGTNGTNGHGKSRPAREVYMGGGDSVNLVFRYNLKFHDAQAEFLFNNGAVRFLEGAASLLADGGLIVIIEFGDLFAYPETTGPEGLQTSIRFKTLQDVAAAMDLTSQFEWVLARLEFDISMRMLGTNRRQFLALRHLFETHGIELQNIAYSKEMLYGLADGKLDLDEVHSVEYFSLNDRVMGVVPSTVKILEVRK